MPSEVPIDQLASLGASFADTHAALVVDSILAGNSLGRVWTAPGGAALLWDQGNNVFYLAAPDLDHSSQSELAELLDGVIRPAALAGGRGHFKVRALDPAASGAQRAPRAPRVPAALPAIFGPLRELSTRLYSLDGPALPVAAPAVERLSFRLIDRAFWADHSLENSAALREEVGWMWPSAERFLDQGFGVAALSGRRLVCWCTAEFRSAGRCGVGIATEPEYAGRGLASAAAARFVDHCREIGVTPFWECRRDNVASVRVAEKVGFALLAEEVFWSGQFTS
jgi:RimJ/RimL family protein N-acetyltransferase